VRFDAADGWRYGLLGLPLAFVALPLYVLLPNHYAAHFGLPLAALGACCWRCGCSTPCWIPGSAACATRLFARSPARAALRLDRRRPARRRASRCCSFRRSR
jgi:hypothetical protein